MQVIARGSGATTAAILHSATYMTRSLLLATVLAIATADVALGQRPVMPPEQPRAEGNRPGARDRRGDARDVDPRSTDPRRDTRADPRYDPRYDSHRGGYDPYYDVDPRSRGRYDDRFADVRVWIEGGDLYRQGTRVRALFRVSDDAFVVIGRIDAMGQLRLLYPTHPASEGLVRAGVTYTVPEAGRDNFMAGRYDGIEYIFAIASWDGFDFDRFGRGRDWDFRRFPSPVRGDPISAIHAFAQSILYDPRREYSVDVAEFHTGFRAPYPRYVCAECHRVDSRGWDPYARYCPVTRVIAYDDYHTAYPYRHYGATRAVQPPLPRFEWERADPHRPVTQRDFVERRRRDPGGAGAVRRDPDVRRDPSADSPRRPATQPPRSPEGGTPRRQP